MSKLKWMRPIIGGCLIVLAPLAQGVMCGEMWKVDTTSDAGYAAAVTALEHQDWTAAVAALEKVLERRGWDDNAHVLLGLSYWKLGKSHASVQHYRLALDLNPYHLAALKHLGEAYLGLGAHVRAKTTLVRLIEACRRVSSASDTSKQECHEWHELKAAIEAQSAH